MSTVDDLLSLRRRGELSEADERRLQIAVQTSPEHQLSLLAGAAFERAGEAQPGDAALVRKIVRQVEGEWSGTFQRVAARRLSRWVSIPLLAAGAAAASFGGYRALQALAPAPVAAPSVAIHAPVPAFAPLPDQAPTIVAPPPAVAPAPAVVPAPAVPAVAASPAPAAEVAPPAAPVPRRHVEPRATRAVPEVRQPLPSAQPAPSAPLASPGETARELFRRAHRLRQSDWDAAAALYTELTQRFADSHEAGVAEMALAKHALSEGHAAEALSWFRAYRQRVGGEQTAEALWGEARALDSLGERAQAQQIWRRLIELYPASAYAAAAREQLGP